MDKYQALKLISMRRAFSLLKERQRRLINEHPEILEYTNKLREIREESVGNWELLDEAIRSLERNNFNVFIAKDKEEALSYIEELVGDEKVVVKSKSNVTREIELEEFLGQRGIEVVDTDIGDRIIQILEESPSHPTGPASHLSAEMIAKALKSKYGFSVGTDAKSIVDVVRRDIEERMKDARVGISGANAVTREGAVVLLHNEGNIFEVITRPEKWVIVTGIDKIYPSVEDAIIAAKVQSAYAAGILLPSFVEIVSGITKTADVEKKLIPGVGNPKEVSIILLDNGRKRLIEGGFKEMFYCIGCGNCVANCPSHAVHGEEFPGGRFALLSALLGDKDALELCLTCGRCKKNCPLSIDIPSMIRKARKSELYSLVTSHIKWLIRELELRAFELELTKLTFLS